MKHKIFNSALLISSAFIFLSSCGGKKNNNENNDNTNQITKYNISFVDDDETTILKEAVAYEDGTKAEDIITPDVPSKYVSNDKYIFTGWSPEIEDVTADATYKATYSKLFKKENNKIYFGTYPQTKVEATVENGLSSIEFDPNTWTSYFYFIESEQPDFMYYLDVDTNNDGLYDYRGVYFTEYRPIYNSAKSTINTSYQDNNGYDPDEIYWFSYDVIEWDILKEKNDKALIISNLILDSQEYYPTSSPEISEHNDGTGYGNNYGLSNIRKFLIDTFYPNVFNDLEKTIIEETTVNNSVESTGQGSNNYVCDNTKDYMFLLSYDEASLLYSDNASRKAIGSDYAKCQGLNDYSGNSGWWLRSPASNFAYMSCDITYDGRLHENGDPIMMNFYGVRPACWINL